MNQRVKRKIRLKKLAEIAGSYAMYDKGYVFSPAERPVLSAEDSALLPPGLKDRGEFHITIIGPPEMKAVPKGTFEKGVKYEIGGAPSYRGLGRAVDGANEAYFMVIDWPEAQQFRAKYGLGEKDLHVTVGFKEKDIHNVRKNQTIKESA